MESIAILGSIVVLFSWAYIKENALYTNIVDEIIEDVDNYNENIFTKSVHFNKKIIDDLDSEESNTEDEIDEIKNILFDNSLEI